MRITLVLSDGHAVGVDPRQAVAEDRALVGELRDRLDGVVVLDGWASAPRWNLNAISYAAFLAGDGASLEVTVRGLPVDVRNPIELAEQLGSIDHAWGGRVRASVRRGTATERGWFGITDAPTRFDEVLTLIRRMWSLEPFAGEGPVFVFDEVRPTLRPVTPGGPPLSLEVADANLAREAAQRDLGLHIVDTPGAARPDAIVAAYRDVGGQRDISLQVEVERTRQDDLAEYAALGVAQLDVSLRRPGDDPAAVRAAAAQLAERTESHRASTNRSEM